MVDCNVSLPGWARRNRYFKGRELDYPGIVKRGIILRSMTAASFSETHKRLGIEYLHSHHEPLYDYTFVFFNGEEQDPA